MSVMPEKRIPGNKIKIKSLATSTPIKGPIPNQDKNTLGIQKKKMPYITRTSISSWIQIINKRGK